MLQRKCWKWCDGIRLSVRNRGGDRKSTQGDPRSEKRDLGHPSRTNQDAAPLSSPSGYRWRIDPERPSSFRTPYRVSILRRLRWMGFVAYTFRVVLAG